MKLAIISHTEHYQNTKGEFVGWGPTISEINHLAKDFDEIYHVAFLYNDNPPPSALPYTSEKIKFVPLKPVGGPGIKNKLNIIFSAPRILRTIAKTLKKTDVFQFRAPTGMGVYVIPYLTYFTRKKGWFKYAGNWNQKNPPRGYAIQRKLLKKQKRIVTINGKWADQPKHCLTFENPCLTIKERKLGEELLKNKKYIPPFDFCFVGRLEDAKGVQRIIDAFGRIKNRSWIGKIHFIGDGPKIENYKKQTEELDIPAVFYGFLSREKVFEIYKRSHFILLPSDSEGFPKVIAEAMNFGSIPIVSDVSSIGQYVNSENGFAIPLQELEKLSDILKNISDMLETDLNTKSKEGYKISSDFTFEHYRSRIQKEIII